MQSQLTNIMSQQTTDVQNALAYPDASSYKQMSQREHVYFKSDMYIGTDKPSTINLWIYDNETNKMILKPIEHIPACERLFLEITSNAADAVIRSRKINMHPKAIDITMNNKTISVTNYGLPIPVEIHPDTKMYVPQMIFGNLLTSSNYVETREGAGTNGVGAKATNIYSTRFKIKIIDHIRKLKYEQEWSNNMTVMSKHKILKTADSIINSSVKVEYDMDFVRFGLDAEKGYSDDIIQLFTKHAIDLSFTTKIDVKFNGKVFNYSNIRDYAKLYFEDDSINNSIIHYQWPTGTKVLKKGKYQYSENHATQADVELMVIDTPDESVNIAFANCLVTINGGVHLTAAQRAVGDTTVKLINEETLKKLVKINRGKVLDPKERKANTITIADVKDHISIIVSVKVLNPKYDSQSKYSLNDPMPNIIVSEDELKGVNKWQLIDRLHAALNAKQFANITRNDNRLHKHVRLSKGKDANEAGKANRSKCVLYITEGDSGAGYANSMLKLIPGGKDFCGILPMRGKSLNVMNADQFQIDKNNEILELKKMLGLIECPDEVQRKTFYLDENNFSRVRYGSVMIMADSDVDGLHIIGLILNFFHCRYPSLLTRGFVMYYQTPTIRVSKNNKILKFYNQQDYIKWTESTHNFNTWKHKYYKGLGTSNDKEVADDFNFPRIVKCVYDDLAPETIKLAFDRKMVMQRKEWLKNWKPFLGIENVEMQPISWFINNKLILFGIAAVQRAIPKLSDGFKDSHRKIIYGAHKKWNIGSKDYPEIKVAQFGAFVASNTHYQHGEQILDHVIVGMAQNFTGANNIAWFTRNGQFGSMVEGGKDAAASRYLFTEPEHIMSKILRKEDRAILVANIEEGSEVEPENYWPIIPMILVNGSQGIGMGHSTNVPNHNPIDLINWLRNKLQGLDTFNIRPWYKGFRGVIEIVDRNLITKVTEEDELLDQTINEEEVTEIENLVPNSNVSKFSMRSYGKYNVDKGVIKITELPIGRWSDRYANYLDILRENKRITSYRNLSNKEEVYFEIIGYKGSINHKELKLIKSIGLSNMVLLDSNGFPIKYESANEIMETFYAMRLPIYQKRKDHMLNVITDDILLCNEKIKFIQAVLGGKLVIMNKKKADIKSQMDSLNISYSVYENSKLSHLSEDDILDLMKDIKDKESLFDQINKTSIKQMWLNDLKELDDSLGSDYKTIVKKLKI